MFVQCKAAGLHRQLCIVLLFLLDRSRSLVIIPTSHSAASTHTFSRTESHSLAFTLSGTAHGANITVFLMKLVHFIKVILPGLPLGRGNFTVLYGLDRKSVV